MKRHWMMTMLIVYRIINPRVLVDFAREACHFPKLNHLEKQDMYETFLSCSNPTDHILESLFLRGSESTPSRGSTLLYDVILMSFKTIMSGVQRSELETVYIIR